MFARHFDRMESEQEYRKLAEDYVTATEDAASCVMEEMFDIE